MDPEASFSFGLLSSWPCLDALVSLMFERTAMKIQLVIANAQRVGEMLAIQGCNASTCCTMYTIGILKNRVKKRPLEAPFL